MEKQRRTDDAQAMARALADAERREMASRPCVAALRLLVGSLDKSSDERKIAVENAREQLRAYDRSALDL